MRSPCARRPRTARSWSSRRRSPGAIPTCPTRRAGKAVAFSFEGPILNVYATLVVRLSHSGAFRVGDLWKNAATFKSRAGGTCGLSLEEVAEGRGRLTLFFDGAASEETRFHFEEYVQLHLTRRALPESLVRRRIFACPGCGEPFTDEQVRVRRSRGKSTIVCPGCDDVSSLLDREERLASTPPTIVVEMDRAADARCRAEADASVRQGRVAVGDFDVFLCYNHADKPAVRAIADRLGDDGLLPWIDDRELAPSQSYFEELERVILNARAAAVFLGRHGIGKFQRMEVEALLNQSVRRGMPLLAVFLPDAPEDTSPPLFLGLKEWVDLRTEGPDPWQRLIRAFTRDGRATVAQTVND